MSAAGIRPTKKQRQLLTFIERFIKEHGYSPSYREIMRALDYNSVATVALHVNNLIARGHLKKRDRSARSLELTQSTESQDLPKNTVKPSEEKWLIDKVSYYFSQLEASREIDTAKLDELYVLIGALKVLGLDGAAQSFLPRLSELKSRASK